LRLSVIKSEENCALSIANAMIGDVKNILSGKLRLKLEIN